MCYEIQRDGMTDTSAGRSIITGRCRAAIRIWFRDQSDEKVKRQKPEEYYRPVLSLSWARTVPPNYIHNRSKNIFFWS